MAETGLGHEYHFLRLGETDFFAEDGKVQRLDAAEQRAVSMHQEPQGAATILVNQVEQG